MDDCLLISKIPCIYNIIRQHVVSFKQNLFHAQMEGEERLIIDVKNLTKDFGSGRGIFDVSISVEKGVCFGFLGPNGAGKTTTIRHLMGFSKPQKGNASILGMDCWKNATRIKENIGYLPGEVVLPKNTTGTEFLKTMKQMRKLESDSYCKELLERFDFNPQINIDDMSLGEKRKLAVVTAFMHDPDVLILDEPTSGLDPIMQQVFIDYILSEKKRGKTILLSSHIFHEVDATCDVIAIIKEGKIVAEFEADRLKNLKSKIYRITFRTKSDYKKFVTYPYQFTSKNPKKQRARVYLEDGNVNPLLADLDGMEIEEFQEIPFTLEDYFMQYYKDNRVFQEVK